MASGVADTTIAWISSFFIRSSHWSVDDADWFQLDFRQTFRIYFGNVQFFDVRAFGESICSDTTRPAGTDDTDIYAIHFVFPVLRPRRDVPGKGLISDFSVYDVECIRTNMIFIVFRSGSPKNKSMIPRNGPSRHVESGFSFSKFCHQGSEHLRKF